MYIALEGDLTLMGLKGHICIYVSIIYLPVYLSIFLSVYLPICLSIFLSACIFANLPIYSCILRKLLNSGWTFFSKEGILMNIITRALARKVFSAEYLSL